MHASLALHARPQLPQFAVSLAPSTQRAPQLRRLSGQRRRQNPSAHDCPGAQLAPHPPQWRALSLVFAHSRPALVSQT
jgi:hypothetical protein